MYIFFIFLQKVRMKNPIHKALSSAVSGGWLVSWDIIVVPEKIKQSKEYSFPQQLKWKIAKVIDIDNESWQIKLWTLFFEESFLINKCYWNELKKINRKNPRGDREIKVWDKIVTKDWLETQILAITPEWVIVSMRGQLKWIECMYYKSDFFRSAFIKQEWRLIEQEFQEFDVNRLIKYIPNTCYLVWNEGTLLCRSSELNVWDVVMCRSEWDTKWYVANDLWDRWLLIDNDHKSVKDFAHVKERVLLTRKISNNDQRFYKIDEEKDIRYFPKWYSEKEVKWMIWLK